MEFMKFMEFLGARDEEIFPDTTYLIPHTTHSP
jgi:hypothetical protein